MKKIKHLGAWTLAIALFTAASCSDDKNNNTGGGNIGTQKFYIATTQGDYTYSLAADDVTTGSVSLEGNGIESVYSFTSFIFNGTNSVTAMQYRQGDPSIGMSFRLNSNGQLETFSNEFQLQKGFTTFGTLNNYAIAARSGQTLADGNTGTVVYFIDQENNNNVSSKELTTTGLNNNATYDDGTGNQVQETGTLCGIIDSGNGTFLTSAVFSHGVVSSGGSSTATVGNPDECWVLELDQNLNVIRKFNDNRIGYSAGRYRSQYYSQMAKDADGNTYVFSGAYDNTSTKSAGAIRIPENGTDFDTYYWDLEAASGGYRFRKVWHLADDTFLLEFYNEQYETLNINSVATQYAIVKMESKSFNWLVNGFPAKDTIVSTGWPYAYEGKMYFPVTVADRQPAIYIIDPATLSATRGLEVNGADNISALSVLKAN